MAMLISTILESISDLHVPGLTIQNIDAIPSDCTRLTPILYPEPMPGTISDFTVTYNSFGGGGTSKMTVEYNLNWTFLYAPAGSGRTGLDYYSGCVGMWGQIIDELLAHDDVVGNHSAAVDMRPEDVTDFGPLPDPAGNMFIGCRFVLHITEFVN